MIRLVLALLICSTPAFAGHRCVEVSDVVGYQQCSRYGATWSGATLWWELGLTSTRVELDPVDRAVTGGRVISAAGAFTANGPRMRDLYGIGEHLYIGSELLFGHIAHGPGLMWVAAARGGTTPTSSSTTGTVAGSALLIGARFNAGPVRFGLELAAGPRFAFLTSTAFPSTIFGGGGLVLETRAEASVWISPHWSVIGLAGTSLLDSHEASLTVGLGVHAFPFDGGR